MLGSAYIHVFIPVEALIWVRSLAIVLLTVAHTLRHVQPQETKKNQPAQPIPMITPELVSQLRVLLSQISISEEHLETPRVTEAATGTQERESQPVPLLPAVSEEEKDK